jgi:hypothetical protein
LCSFRAAFGPFFQVFGLTFWSFSKILLFFHHGEHGGHGEIFAVYVIVMSASWLKIGFLTESKRSGERLTLAAQRASAASQLIELTKMKDRHEVECWFATEAWLLGYTLPA